MTNILLLYLSVAFTNSFPYGATDKSGGWSSGCSYNAELTYVAPAGVYVVEGNYNAQSAKPIVENGQTNGWIGSNFQILNCGGLTNGVYNGLGPYPTEYPAPRGFYTNLSPTPSTNTIRFPIPYWNKMFFQLKKIA